MATSYYDILGVPPHVGHEALRTAYLRLAGGSHPDLNHLCPDAELRFKAIQIAYETLRDPTSRQRYDLGIVEEPVVHAHGHQRDGRSAKPWPYEDAHAVRDVDFDITAKQSTLSGRSRQSTTVLMAMVVVIATGVLILSMGRWSKRSATASEHQASQRASAPASAGVRAPAEEPLDLAFALALVSEEVASHANRSERSAAFEFGMLVTDPSFVEPLSATRRAINVEAAPPSSEAKKTRSDPVAAAVTQELFEPTLVDSGAMPLALPTLDDGLPEQSEFSMQFMPKAIGTADLDFLDDGASDPASPPVFIDAPAALNRQASPDFLPPWQVSVEFACVTGLDPSTVPSLVGVSHLFDVPLAASGDREPDHPWKRLTAQGSSAADHPSISRTRRSDRASHRRADFQTDSPVVGGVAQPALPRQRAHRLDDPASFGGLQTVNQNAIDIRTNRLHNHVPGVARSVPGSPPSSSPPTFFQGFQPGAFATVTSGLPISATAYGKPTYAPPWLANPTPSKHAPASPTGFAPH